MEKENWSKRPVEN